MSKTSPLGTIWLSEKHYFFFENLATDALAFTSEFIAEDLSRVINQLQADNANSGAVTDNTSSIKKAWKFLQLKYPAMFFHGCVTSAETPEAKIRITLVIFWRALIPSFLQATSFCEK